MSLEFQKASELFNSQKHHKPWHYGKFAIFLNEITIPINCLCPYTSICWKIIALFGLCWGQNFNSVQENLHLNMNLNDGEMKDKDPKAISIMFYNFRISLSRTKV